MIFAKLFKFKSRDHNATSYSTETLLSQVRVANSFVAEIITLRAIALKLSSTDRPTALKPRRDHNATSYSTETFSTFRKKLCTFAEIITLRAIALKRQNSLNG